jgi:hypothetical protein
MALAKVLGQPAGEYQLGSYPTNNVDGCGDWSKGRPLVDVSIAYGGQIVPSEFDAIERVGGRPAGVTNGDSQCWLTWNQGPSAQPDRRDKWVRIVLRAPTCAETKRLAARLMAQLAGPVPAGAAPQAPPLYGPAAPDSNRPGACVDLEVTAEQQPPCQPYYPVPAPKGAVEVYRRGNQDGNVACAISHDAVRRVLGAGLRPVVEGSNCVYVEQRHALEVRIWVADRTVGEGVAPRKIELNGRTGLVSTLRSDQDGKEVYLRAEDATGVVLAIQFTFNRPRGGGELDTGREAKLEPLAGQVLEQSF